MKEIKKLLSLLLALGMVLCLCTACGEDGTKDETPSDDVSASQPADESETPSGGEENDGTVTYTITVVDADGSPIAGALVQICKEACIPGATDENGVAQFTVAEDEYKVSFVMLPEGYTAEAENFYFEDGSHELTIVLTPAE